MRELNVHKVAVTVGLVFGGWHLVWSILVGFGFAQPLLTFIFWLHMLTTPVRVTGFTFTQSVLLIFVTFLVGYVVGYIFASVWNTAHR